jgi:hypothetical protein
MQAAAKAAAAPVGAIVAKPDTLRIGSVKKHPAKLEMNPCGV